MRPHVFPGRPVRYGLVGLVSWLAFGAGWWLVVRRHAQVQAGILVALVLTAIEVWLVTMLWVARNRHIYRVKGPRSAVTPVRDLHPADRFGRPLVILPAARLTGEVVLRLTADGRKSYEPVGAPR